MYSWSYWMFPIDSQWAGQQKSQTRASPHAAHTGPGLQDAKKKRLFSAPHFAFTRGFSLYSELDDWWRRTLVSPPHKLDVRDRLGVVHGVINVQLCDVRL